MLYIYMML